MPMPSLEAVLAALVTAVIEEMRQRSFENAPDLEWIELKLEGWLHPSDHGRNAKP
jgi:hypothetical protein